MRRSVQAGGVDHRADIAQLLEQVALEFAGTGGGVQVGSDEDRGLDFILQAVQHRYRAAVIGVRVENRGHHLEIDLRRQRGLMRQCAFRRADRVGSSPVGMTQRRRLQTGHRWPLMLKTLGSAAAVGNSPC